jgi:glutamine synthetase
MPLCSLEVELGPSQYEFTFAPEPGLAAADTMVLFRSALKQVARRHGHLVSFMCRPRPDDHFGDFGFDVSGRFSKFGYRKFRS